MAADQGVAKRGPVSAFFATRPKTRLGLLLTPPLLWLVVAYLGSIVVLLFTSFWSVNSFTGAVVPTFQLGNIVSVFTEPLYREVTLRTIVVALSVTVIDAVIAFPMAFYMAKIASPRTRAFFLVAVTTPLWASYLVKAYAWRVLLEPNGPIDILTGGHSPGYGLPATVITLSYLWLPYMIIPLFAGFDRVPSSLIEASADLGASTARTVRSVILPLVFPAIAAGSIFTFSLSLGDYIAVTIVGGKTQLLANLIYGQLVTANNQPLAAALSIVPLIAIIIYLLAMRRTGALENI
ncbi:MAG: ABC transporter permease [Pseudolysinimonas sp.]